MDTKNLHQQEVFAALNQLTPLTRCVSWLAPRHAQEAGRPASFRMASRCATACARAFTKVGEFSQHSATKTRGHFAACSLIPCSFSTCISSSSFASHWLFWLSKKWWWVVGQKKTHENLMKSKAHPDCVERHHSPCRPLAKLKLSCQHETFWMVCEKIISPNLRYVHIFNIFTMTSTLGDHNSLSKKISLQLLLEF